MAIIRVDELRACKTNKTPNQYVKREEEKEKKPKQRNDIKCIKQHQHPLGDKNTIAIEQKAAIPVNGYNKKRMYECQYCMAG